MARTMTPPNYATDEISVLIRIFMDGIELKVLNGLNNLKVLIPLTDLNEGISVSKELTTTMKSSQFQGSLR